MRRLLIIIGNAETANMADIVIAVIVIVDQERPNGKARLDFGLDSGLTFIELKKYEIDVKFY